MLILTPYGQAINARHVVRLYLQTDRNPDEPGCEPSRQHLMVQLTCRHCLIIAASLEEQAAFPLFKEVARHWLQGKSYCDISDLLKRLQSGEPEETRRKAVCL